LRQKRERGDITPLPHSGSVEAILKEEHLLILTEVVAESPDATLEELQEQMKKRDRFEASIPTIWRPLVSPALTRNKVEVRRQSRPGSRGPRSRRKQIKLPVERLVFIDKFGINTSMTRTTPVLRYLRMVRLLWLCLLTRVKNALVGSIENISDLQSKEHHHEVRS